jgi:hypothetical protein
MIFGRLWEEANSEISEQNISLHDSRIPGFRQAKRDMRQISFAPNSDE